MFTISGVPPRGKIPHARISRFARNDKLCFVILNILVSIYTVFTVRFLGNHPRDTKPIIISRSIELASDQNPNDLAVQQLIKF
uniref:Uncharacterized protein n=1 Tax=Candidatus Kentrum sp. MB TaxID=2138164 RepID=A0A451B9T7_9GAMM|nr:MAG: hypothetical protein BECKMB1821I_GA0114274_101352 [Candidatus Kentron sp. MB]VFK75056.1 MAG: hypothetical protein BECKMB1821H_GA0114242_101452 [Candidatus Kentron sp. MB]